MFIVAMASAGLAMAVIEKPIEPNLPKLWSAQSPQSYAAGTNINNLFTYLFFSLKFFNFSWATHLTILGYVCSIYGQ